MAYRYGVDPNGNPVQADGGPQMRGSTDCPQGQQWDAQQQRCQGGAQQIQSGTPAPQPQLQPSQPPQSGPQMISSGQQPQQVAQPPGTTPQPGPGTTLPQTGPSAPPGTPPGVDPYTGQPAADPATLANHQALWNAGIAQGRSPADLRNTTPDQLKYWDDKIAGTGGLSQYWLGRMAERPGQGGGGGGQAGAMSPTDFLRQSGPMSPNFTPPPNFTPGTMPQLPYASYKPSTFTPLSPYQADPTQKSEGDLIQQLLGSGGSMGPDAVAKMREASKDSTLAMTDQIRQQIMQGAAGRGTGQGGVTGANLANLDMAQLGTLSGNYRDIDINAAKTNFQDKLSAIGAAGGYNNQLLDQYLQTSGLRLGQEQAQAGENLKGYQSDTEQGQRKMQDWFANQGLGMGASQNAFQNWLSSQGLNLNWRQLAEQARQYDLGNQLDVAKFLGQ
jgi:hypothetical protein